MESKASELEIPDIRLPIFLQLLEFLYSDSVKIPLASAMELFQAADRFSVERLKKKCELVMLSAINTETAAQILLTADVHNAESLRERCMRFMLANFDAVSMTEGFEDMSR